jgi:hypothetical protein
MADVEKSSVDAIPDRAHDRRNRLENSVSRDVAPYEGMSPGQYLATRFSSLKPPMHEAPNPIRLLRMLNRMHWAFFGVAFFGWVGKPRPCALFKRL